MTRKSTVEEIRERFDNDVERFSNLETGQSATVDAPLGLDLIAGIAGALHPEATHLLDIGCGAGNYSLKLMQRLPLKAVTLIDLSKPMLDRAVERIRNADPQIEVVARQGDVRNVSLGEHGFDVAVAAATLHHLRKDEEWHAVFSGIHRALKPGGSFWIWDMVTHDLPQVQNLMWDRYGQYLHALGGAEYRDRVFAYIEKEDTPRPLTWQLEQLRAAGFHAIEVLHKNSCFAAFGGIKSAV